MSSKNGSNGIIDGEANARAFSDWTTNTVDYKPFIRQGELNITLIARECGLNRDVFYTNPTIKSKLLPKLRAQLLASKILKEQVATRLDAVASNNRPSPAFQQRLKEVEERNEALVAEVKELHRRLARCGAIEGALHVTGRLPW